mmetsp:Transcript_15414/g.43106  ORF Transcript_15414/g.43106 Transcript_15414/m.43106 type:complete len:802 (-) Transcript_15414:42-2447(-)|eukprot:CAMPEP_0117664304 /NCGR_PEP_ID=MMETSP0804-20121206/9142_1 /TAXON_ID=1074897 /ORGANISM="Tetraselmis astigmatica, Strain CCMP880" /LENGTH=801 /DNA_ID=CAMNT_0005471515 /DNA_START=438 /DNA_END=2843 /DNA_ORIENTATION=+
MTLRRSADVTASAPTRNASEQEQASSSSNVSVVVRVRPLSAAEAALEESTSGSVDVRGPKDLALGGAAGGGSAGGGRRFAFDQVIAPGVPQESVFRRVGKPVADNCLAGYNSTVLAYGQTGSGKTHTMLGDCSYPDSARTPRTSPDVVGDRSPLSSPETTPRSSSEAAAGPSVSLPIEAGLTPRVFQYLFQQMAEKASTSCSSSVKVSFVEIYNEVVSDLLSSATNLPVRQSVESRRTYVEGAHEEQVFDLADVIRLVVRGSERRQVAHTNMNAASSRSHSILTATIESRTEEDGGIAHIRRSVLNLVDLAGSERQARTGATGQRLKEASSINKSLSTLGMVIKSLVSGAAHVPYRDSKLTHVLQDSLGGNAKAVLIAAVSPSTASLPETESTLGFAARAKHMKNSAVINQDAVGDAMALRTENERLRKELEAFRALEASRGAIGSVTALASENAALRADLDALRVQLPAGPEADSEDDAVVDAEAQWRNWQQNEDREKLRLLLHANLAMDQKLEELLAANCSLEDQLEHLTGSNATLRSTVHTLSAENSNLRATAELVEEFNAAFQRATREADASLARVATLEAEKARMADEMRLEKFGHKEESHDHELLLQEFSELTKLLGEAALERDQAIADRDAALAQKLEMSRRYHDAEEQLQAVLKKKTAVKRQLMEADCQASPEAPTTPEIGVSPLNSQTVPRPAPVSGEPKDPFLKLIIQRLDSIDRVRSNSVPGSPTVAAGTPRSQLARVLKERDDALASLAKAEEEKAAAQKSLHWYKQMSLQYLDSSRPVLPSNVGAVQH